MVFKITIVGSIPASLVLFSMKTYFYIFFSFFFSTNVGSSIFFFKKLQKKNFQKIIYLRSYDFFLLELLFSLKVIFFKNFRVFFKSQLNNFSSYSLSGLLFLWKHIRIWLPVLLLLTIIFYISLTIRLVPITRISVEWFFVTMSGYWLISGFIFFTKKYKFGKFTGAIQRFWRRSYILFWLVECSLFAVFIYLALNASQEIPYTFDILQLDKMRLYSWKNFLFKAFFVFLIIILCYVTLISLKWNTFSQTSIYLLFITIILTYVVWLEFYQFFYTVNWYGEIAWFFDLDDKIWYSDIIYKRARIVNHYVTICTIAKFWHIIFIYVYWIFFLLRTLESKHINYIFFSTNLQNFIILYIMNWILMYPWLKFIGRRFLTKTHNSLHEFHVQYLYSFFYDFLLFIEAFFNYSFNPPKRFFNTRFIYIIEPQQYFSDFQFSKDFIKFELIDLLNLSYI